MSDSEQEPRRPDLETLFHEALELRPEARAAHVRAHCGDRPELRDELLELLAAHDAAPTGLEAPAWGLGDRFDELFERAGADALEAARPGARLGHYEVQRRLGQGGMGAVYLALQRQPLRRLVALKLIKPGMDTREVVRRFASERQALARLNHPGIAAVHDAGVTEQGRPYFVMEYVPGARITDFCDARRLGLRERLELFVQVCRAAQHAHAQGIVHRDLKPGNVLVRDGDDPPLPKIIDFGVAKAMVGPRGASTLSTRQGQVLGTPGYMSPEQAGAVDAPVDARSDVYSLGALLHELLTGLLPHERKRLRGASLATRLRETPPPASQRVASLGRRARRLAQRRQLSARQLQRALRGDLDAILARALAPHPAERYASVAALSTDLTAWLAGRAVRAPRVPSVLSPRRLASLPTARAAAFVVAAAGLGAWVWPAPPTPRLDRASALDAPAAQRAAPAREVTVPAAACTDGVFDGLDAGQAARRQLVLNVDEVALLPGTTLQLVGHGSWQGRELLHVRAARTGDDAPLTGVLQCATAAHDHAGRSHLHALDGALEPGAPGVLLGAGGLASALVDVPAAGLRAGDALGPGRWPGHLGVPTAGAAVLGFAAEAHAPGLARVSVWVQPQALPALERGAPSVAVFEAPSRDGSSAATVPPAQHADDAATWQRAQPVPLVAQAHDDASGGVAGGVALIGVGVLGDGAAHPASMSSAHHDAVEPGMPMPAVPQGEGAGHDSGGEQTGPSAVVTDMGLSKSTHTENTPPDKKQVPRTLKHASVEQTWIDFEGDGLLDLAWHAPGAAPKLYVQVDPGRFEERSDLGNFAEVWTTDQRTLLDANADGRVDLVGVDALGALQLWEGLGDGSFLDATAERGLAGLEVARVRVIDVDGDAAPDLLAELPDAGLVVLRNRKGVFERVLFVEPAPSNLQLNPAQELDAPQSSGPGWSQSHGDQ